MARTLRQMRKPELARNVFARFISGRRPDASDLKRHDAVTLWHAVTEADQYFDDPRSWPDLVDYAAWVSDLGIPLPRGVSMTVADNLIDICRRNPDVAEGTRSSLLGAAEEVAGAWIGDLSHGRSAGK